MNLYLEEVGSTLTYLKLRKIQRLMDHESERPRKIQKP